MTFIKYVGTPFIPKDFWHNPSLKNSDGKTVAMLSVENNIPIIYDLWRHDPNIQDRMGIL